METLVAFYIVLLIGYTALLILIAADEARAGKHLPEGRKKMAA